MAAGGQIAWLIKNVAPLATNQADYQGLQGLIWHLLNPGSVAFDFASNSAGASSAYNTYSAALGSNTAAVSSVLWVNPLNAPDGQYTYQGLVAAPTPFPPSSVAEPETLILLGVGLFGFAASRKKNQAHPSRVSPHLGSVDNDTHSFQHI